MGQSLEAHIRKLQDLYWSAADPEGRGFVPLADAYRRAGDFLEARRVLREGMDRHPDFASGHVVSGWVSLEHSRPEEAETSFKAALGLDPRNIAALRGLAGILMERGQVETALGFLRDLLQEDPVDADLPARIRDMEERIERSAGPGMSAEHPLEAPTEPIWGDLQDAAEELDWSSATLQPDVSPRGEEVGLPEGAADRAVDEGAPDSAPDGEAPDSAPDGAAPGRDEDEFDGPWVAEDGVPVPDLGGRGDTLVTSTLGEIYFRQGYLEWAEEVFRTVLDRDPGNEALRDRLLEVRALRHERNVGTIVPIEHLAPDTIVSIEHLAPDTIVSIELLAPDTIFPIELLAPGAVVSIESLAPDSSTGGESGTASEVDGVRTGGDRTLDAFQAWLDTLQ